MREPMSCVPGRIVRPGASRRVSENSVVGPIARFLGWQGRRSRRPRGIFSVVSKHAQRRDKARAWGEFPQKRHGQNQTVTDTCTGRVVGEPYP